VEEVFKRLAGSVALGVELAAALLIVFGAVEALYLTFRRLLRGSHSAIHRKQVWVGFALWLVLALEFELAADVIRTAISPTWNDIGQLGAIAAIRTVLNYFLEKDIDTYARSPGDAP
jgi:uncharacterized membrane protein